MKCITNYCTTLFDEDGIRLCSQNILRAYRNREISEERFKDLCEQLIELKKLLDSEVGLSS